MRPVHATTILILGRVHPTSTKLPRKYVGTGSQFEIPTQHSYEEGKISVSFIIG